MVWFGTSAIVDFMKLLRLLYDVISNLWAGFLYVKQTVVQFKAFSLSVPRKHCFDLPGHISAIVLVLAVMT